MDFVSDSMATGQTVRVLTVVDDYTRECLAMETDTSLSGWRVRRVLDRITGERGRPEAIVVDNGLNARTFLRRRHTYPLAAPERDCGRLIHPSTASQWSSTSGGLRST